jgi:hypothetical protein
LELAELKKDKVGKNEFSDHLPEYLSPEAISNKIREHVEERFDSLNSSFENFRVTTDTKIVKIR